MNEENIKKQVGIIKSVLYKNLMENYVPFQIDRDVASRWAKPLNVPRGGKTILYTSFMYQMGSLFKSYEKYIPTFGSLGSSRIISSIGSKLIRAKSEDIQRAGKILSNIYNILRRYDPDLGYLYEDEPYSGALLYEMGFLEEFNNYGRKLMEFFKKKGVERIITVDPHTTNSLNNMKKSIGFSIPFVSYLNVIQDVRGEGKFVFHDSCLYSRFLGMYNDIRATIKNTGVVLVEDPTVTGIGNGFCCGAPVGPVDSRLSDRIAQSRADNLKTLNENILVACPLCYANLSPFGHVVDIAEVIS